VFCSNCGTDLPDQAQFCDKCGTDLRTSAPAPEDPGAQQPPGVPAARFRTRTLLAALGGVVIAGLAGAAFLALSAGGDDDQLADGTPMPTLPPESATTEASSTTTPPASTATAGGSATAEASASATVDSSGSAAAGSPSPEPSMTEPPATTAPATVAASPKAATATPTKTPQAQATAAPSPTPTKTPQATATQPTVATTTPPGSGTLSGVLYLDTGSGASTPAGGYPIRFIGPGGTFDVTTNGAGQFTVVLPSGTYQVVDGYAEAGCAVPPIVTPASVSIAGGAQQVSFFTTGCVLF
jgi:hypothetical protein